MVIVEVNNLHKSYNIPDKTFMEKANPLLKIFYRKYVKKEVLKGISFSIEEGEVLGYIGRNGAGKTTTIKILSGILSYDKGSVKVLGLDPYVHRKELSKEISVVFGNRDLLFFDIPVMDSLKFYQNVFNIEDEEFHERVNRLAKILGVGKLLDVPLRKLSFGQRRKVNVLGAFLNSPRLVLLDEPTIGLDIFAKEEMRRFLKHINKKENTTIVLTSHYMEDIESLADRIIILEDGKIIEDAPYEEIISKFDYKIVKVILHHTTPNILEFLEAKILEKKNNALVLLVHKKELLKVIKAYDKGFVSDIEIRSPSLEEVLKMVYYNDKNDKIN